MYVAWRSAADLSSAGRGSGWPESTLFVSLRSRRADEAAARERQTGRVTVTTVTSECALRSTGLRWAPPQGVLRRITARCAQCFVKSVRIVACLAQSRRDRRTQAPVAAAQPRGLDQPDQFVLGVRGAIHGRWSPLGS
jgi:hypothetical protein